MLVCLYCTLLLWGCVACSFCDLGENVVSSEIEIGILAGEYHGTLRPALGTAVRDLVKASL